MKFKHEKAVMRRFVFDAPKISILKARAASATVPQPTRGAYMENCNDFVAIAIAIGVASSCQLAQTTEPPRYRTTPSAISCLTSPENYVKKLEGSNAISTIFEAAKEVGNLSGRDDIKFYNSLSWCRFGVYEADFGWGKPIWVSLAGASGEAPDIFVLLDARDGGIEAWVLLNEEEMGTFQRNEELLKSYNFVKLD
ncbi:hypothetical protein V6N11_067592 [Hibiscus sabdariffa]|uniref:Uncharacterized protein n=1 Tax=Hibiscus sabdariffa TaxID=183260 RepID=A0ABR2SS23_9ROSI